jgi:hypothetical protein
MKREPCCCKLEEIQPEQGDVVDKGDEHSEKNGNGNEKRRRLRTVGLPASAWREDGVDDKDE